MLNPTNTSEILIWACLAIMTGVPFFFKNWLDRTRPILAETVQKRTQILSTVIFVALFTGGFAFGRKTEGAGMVLLFAAIISFSLLYQFAGRYQAQMNRIRPDSMTRHKASLRQTSGRLVIGALLLWIFSKSSLFILFVPLAIPFLGPIFMRLQHACHPMSDSPLKRAILSRFADEDLALSRIYIIDDPRSSEKNAFITGMALGAGPFGRTLFITLPLIQALNEEELFAVVLHEAAHLKYKHPYKRIFWSVALMVVAAFWFAVPVAVVAPGNLIALICSVGLTLLAQAFLLSRLISKQEHEADLMAIRMGASSDAMIRALQKLTLSKSEPENRLLRLLSGNLYPTHRARIATILNCEIAPDLKVIRNPVHILAYSLVVIGISLSGASARIHPAKLAHSAEIIAGR